MTLPTISNEDVIALHHARTGPELATALFQLISSVVPNHLQVLALRPPGGDIQAFCSMPQLLPVYEKYLLHSHSDDWMNCDLCEATHAITPHFAEQNPKLKSMKQSRFYKNFMHPVGAEFAFSLITWREDNWSACVTILKLESQRDFSAQEKAVLLHCREHFQSAVERVLDIDDEHLCKMTLERFVWGLPSAAIVLDWDLKPLYFNASALELAEFWKTDQRYSKRKKSLFINLPADIIAEIEKAKRELNTPGNTLRPNQKVIPLLDVTHARTPELTTKVSYCPGDSAGLGKGTFLVNLQYRNASTNPNDIYDGFAQLSPRERDVVLLAAKGLKSKEISEQLGTACITVRTQLHSAYKKLRISSRYELVLMFSQNPLFTEVASKAA